MAGRTSEIRNRYCGTIWGMSDDVALHPSRDVRVTRAMASLREIAQTLSAAWDLDTTLDLIASRTEQVMQVDSCSIYLLDPGSDVLRLRASTRLARDAVGRASLRW